MAPATLEAPAAEPGGRAGGGAEGKPPTPSVSPGRADFGSINGSSSDDSRIISDYSNNNDSGDLPALVGDLRGAWRFSASSPHCKVDARGPSHGT